MAQPLRQPADSSAASPPGQATLPALPNHPAGSAPPLRSAAKAGLLRSSPRSLACSLTPAYRVSGPAARPPNHEPPHARQRVRPHPNQSPRGQPSPPFPTLPPPRCATSARCFSYACAPLSLRLPGSGRSGHCVAVPPLSPPHQAARFAECPLGAAPQTPVHHAPANAVSSSLGPPAPVPPLALTRRPPGRVHWWLAAPKPLPIGI